MVGDGAFCTVPLLQYCQRKRINATIVTRLRLDTRLFDEPGPQPEGKPGPKPKKGKRHPTLVALSQKKGWKEVLLSWYGAQERPLLIKSGKSLWHRKGYAPVPVRWVLISDPEGHFEPLALCCSNPQVKAGQMTALRVPLGDKVVHPTLESGGDF